MLLLVVEDETSVGAVDKALTENLPKGDACMALLVLVRIWKPKNTTKQHELENKFNNSKHMDVDKPPDKWFQHLTGIVVRLQMDFKVTYNNDKVIRHILHNLMPEEYKNNLDSIKRETNHNVVIDLEGVKVDICEKYGNINKCKRIMTTTRNIQKRP
jgi:hypothetical protein